MARCIETTFGKRLSVLDSGEKWVAKKQRALRRVGCQQLLLIFAWNVRTLALMISSDSACAIASPSLGDVPRPSSSMITTHCLQDEMELVIIAIVLISLEKVERPASIESSLLSRERMQSTARNDAYEAGDEASDL